jgi:hypothetical protein
MGSGAATRRRAGRHVPAHQAVTDVAVQVIHPVPAAQGTPEADEVACLILEVLPRLARKCRTLAGTGGGVEHASCLSAGPGADTCRRGVHGPGAGPRLPRVACNGRGVSGLARLIKGNGAGDGDRGRARGALTVA